MEMTGSEIILECLKREEVEVIFGLPGGAVIDLYHDLEASDIRHILVRHEQGAAHMADGYARATGKVGVALVTSGPGATNTVTGIATAHMDSIPIVVFTGQVPTALIGNDAFQEADIVGISRPCTKHNYLVKDVRDLARIIREAFYVARSGRPGPVLVDLPKDVIKDKCEFKYLKKLEMPGYKPTTSAHLGQVRRAVDLILKSKKPVIYGGGGIISSDAAKEFTQFAKLLDAPTTCTLMGLGAFPASNDLWMGMLGMHGTFRANMAITNCDLIIGIGARFDDRVTGKLSEFAPSAKIIHVDIDPSSISKNVLVHIPIVGDCKDTLKKFNQVLKERSDDLKEIKKTRATWHETIRKWKETRPLDYEQDDKVIKPQYVVEMLYHECKGDAIVTTEVGQNQMWAAQFFHFEKPRTLLTSGGLGTMGYGLPAAIGAQIAFPDRLVIDIAGDGSIQMCIQELTTAVINKLPVKVAILNNSYLGMVRQWQQLFYERRYAATSLAGNPDFVKLAEAYGAVGLRATKPDEVVPVIREAFKVKRPVVMEFVVAEEEGVYPMVPAGAALTEMLLV